MTYENKSKEELIAELNHLLSNEETIRENNTRIELAIDAVNMAWWNMDIITGEVLFHKRKAEMLGYPPERFKHYRDFMNLVHPDDYEHAMEAMRSHFKGLAPTYDTEYRILTAHGNYRWFYDIGSIVKRTPEGAPQKIIGFVIDITKQKQAELEILNKNKELQKLIAEKDKFYSIVAHDLRSPLGAFIQIAELIEEDSVSSSGSKKHDLLVRLIASARNSFKLLEDLLQWTRIQRGTLEFNPQMILVNEHVRISLQALLEPARLKNIELVVDITQAEVFADSNMLQTIIRNLTSNAIKFTPAGGVISISAYPLDNGGTEITVKDTGIGMDEDLCNKLFRMDVVTKRYGTNHEQGNGLGLLLCKELIEKHGGTIWVKSEEDKGSTFGVVLPPGRD